MDNGTVITTYRRRACGQALVPVIFVMLILTVVAVSSGISASRSAHAAGNYVNQLQSSYAARGAMNYATSALAQTSNNGSTYGIVPPLPDTDSNGWAQMGDAWVKIEVIDTGAFLNLNSVDLPTLQRMPVFRDNPDLANAVIAWRGTATTTGTTGTGATGATGTAAGASASTTATGDDPYQSLSTPYTLKNAPYDTVEELLLVQGMTPTLLYGNAAGSPISALDAEADAANGVTSTSSSSTSGSSVTSTGSRAAGVSRLAKVSRQGAAGTGAKTGTTTVGGAAANATGAAAAAEDFSDIYTDSKVVLAQLFTTVSRERNVSTDGNPRLNVNTATAQNFQDQLGLTAAQANGIIRFRTPQTGGTGGGGQATPAPAAPRAPATGANLRSVEDAYSLTRQLAGAGAAAGGQARPPGTGTPGMPPPNSAPTVGGAARPGGGAGAGATTTQAFKTIADVLEVNAFTRSVMQRVADKLSVDDKVFHENLVNINTAPAEVLAAVPGMTHNILNAILNYRQAGTYFQDLGDFFALQDLQRTDFQAVVAHLTTKTSTYYVHIKVRSGEQQSTYAVSAMVEMSDNGAHVLQWREVPRVPGWSTWLKPPTLPTPTLGQNSSGTASAQ